MWEEFHHVIEKEFRPTVFETNVNIRQTPIQPSLTVPPNCTRFILGSHWTRAVYAEVPEGRIWCNPVELLTCILEDSAPRNCLLTIRNHLWSDRSLLAKLRTKYHHFLSAILKRTHHVIRNCSKTLRRLLSSHRDLPRTPLKFAWTNDRITVLKDRHSDLNKQHSRGLRAKWRNRSSLPHRPYNASWGLFLKYGISGLRKFLNSKLKRIVAKSKHYLA